MPLGDGTPPLADCSSESQHHTRNDPAMLHGWIVLFALVSFDADLMPGGRQAIPPVFARELLRRVGPSENMEAAAFVVRREDGGLALVHWPREPQYRRTTWKGTMPAGVVAILHTHPASIPRPSPQDVSEARRLHMPLFVVTRRSVCVAMPDATVACGPASAKPRPKPRRETPAADHRLAASLEVNAQR